MEEVEMAGTATQPAEHAARLQRLEERLEALSGALQIAGRPRTDQAPDGALENVLARTDAQLAVVKNLAAVLQQQTSGWDAVDQTTSAIMLHELELLCQGLRSAAARAGSHLEEAYEALRRARAALIKLGEEMTSQQDNPAPP